MECPPGIGPVEHNNTQLCHLDKEEEEWKKHESIVFGR